MSRRRRGNNINSYNNVGDLQRQVNEAVSETFHKKIVTSLDSVEESKANSISVIRACLTERFGFPLTEFCDTKGHSTTGYCVSFAVFSDEVRLLSINGKQMWVPKDDYSISSLGSGEHSSPYVTFSFDIPYYCINKTILEDSVFAQKVHTKLKEALDYIINNKLLIEHCNNWIKCVDVVKKLFDVDSTVKSGTLYYRAYMKEYPFLHTITRGVIPKRFPNGVNIPHLSPEEVSLIQECLAYNAIMKASQQ